MCYKPGNLLCPLQSDDELPCLDALDVIPGRPVPNPQLLTNLLNRESLVIESGKSVHEMSSESKWRETTVSGGKGPSVYGRNLGTSA